jgi:hypothetical protein
MRYFIAQVRAHAFYVGVLEVRSEHPNNAGHNLWFICKLEVRHFGFDAMLVVSEHPPSNKIDQVLTLS